MELAQPRLASREEIFARCPARAERVRFASLWVAGDLAGLERIAVAIVGTRAPSEGGRERAGRLAQELAEAGICVVSGLALGIDGAAHAGALAGGGPTIGVLGGGHGHFFPRANRTLAERILANGGAVLSPFAPEEPARPWQFLERNGVVAALADAVVVVEAAERSGALNTAGWAGTMSVDVLAFPGDVDRAKAAGTNALIRDGATLVRHSGDVLDALGLVRRPPLPLARAARRLDPLESAVLAELGAEARTLDALLERTACTAGQLLACLVRLELDGVVRRRSDSLEYVLAK